MDSQKFESKKDELKQSTNQDIGYYNKINKNTFDIRLKENFKLFVSGPSRCGKTVFVSKLLENIHSFGKLPPEIVLYIYKVWQPKYDEIETLGVIFIEDSENIVDEIKSYATGRPMVVIYMI